MAELKFVIVDNHTHQVDGLRSLLVKLGYSRRHIWPAKNEVFHNWSSVFDKLVEIRAQGWDPGTNCVVALLDLALDPEDHSYNEGTARIAAAHAVLEPYVTVILTLSAGAAEEHLHSTADAVIDRTRTGDEPERASETLRLALHEALRRWERRVGRTAPAHARSRIKVRDSAGARRVEAAIGADLVKEIAEQVAVPPTDILVRVLTGGYSGAYVLRVDWRDDGGKRSVVCKVANDERVLEEEMLSWRRAASAYRALAGLIPPFVDTRVRQLGSKRAWYVVQSTAPGDTLEETLITRSAPGTRMERTVEDQYRPLLDGLSRMARESAKSGLRTMPLPSRFLLREEDVERFESALPLLGEFRDACVNRGYLPDEEETSRAGMRLFMARVVERWKDALSDSGFGEILVYEQHGDLNPRNILLGVSPSFQIIDFARYDLWPAGYDLARLELQLFLRIMDTRNLGDVFPDRLNAWRQLWMAPETEGAKPAGEEENYLLLWFSRQLRKMHRELVADRDGGDVRGERATRLMALETAFDAIKICSYQDATWSKRLWGLLVAIQSAQKAGLYETGTTG